MNDLTKKDCPNDCAKPVEKDPCVKTAEIKVLSKQEVCEAGFKFSPSCGHTQLPDGGYSVKVGEPCPTEPCPTCAVINGEVIDEPCTVVGKLKVEDYGCNWIPDVCIPSVPPAIGCAPIDSGEGGYDGGVAEWTGNCLEGCDLAIKKAIDPNFQVYLQDNWAHVLDLATHPETTTQLMVRSNNSPREINLQEWHALAYKMFRTGLMAGAAKELLSNSNIGLAFVSLGTDTYGLTTTLDGMAVGAPLPLVTITDNDGNVTGVQFPIPT